MSTWPKIPFACGDLDRADVRRRDDAWLATTLASPTSRFMILWRGRPAVDERGGLRLYNLESGAPLLALAGPPIFLGVRADAQAIFAVSVDAPEPPTLPGGDSFSEARSAAMTLTAGDAGAFAQARSLFEWHRHHGFCSRCGAPTQIVNAGYKRRCQACSAEHFPRTDPVAIMIVTRGDRCLLGRQPRFPPNLFTCLAGFVEPGETIEDAVRRETLEEAGITCGAVRYLGAQPWPFPSQLMLGCIAEALTEEITIDGEELSEARWFDRSQVRSILAGEAEVWVPPPLAIAHHLIQHWAAQPE